MSLKGLTQLDDTCVVLVLLFMIRAFWIPVFHNIFTGGISISNITSCFIIRYHHGRFPMVSNVESNRIERYFESIGRLFSCRCAPIVVRWRAVEARGGCGAGFVNAISTSVSVRLPTVKGQRRQSKLLARTPNRPCRTRLQLLRVLYIVSARPSFVARETRFRTDILCERGNNCYLNPFSPPPSYFNLFFPLFDNFLFRRRDIMTMIV